MEYYKALKIDKNADQDKIKKAYRKAAMKYHPDRNPDNKEAEEKFKLVNEAYSVLSDLEKRQIYDQHGKNGLKAGGHNPHHQNPHDIFNDLFGGAFKDFFGNQRRRDQKNVRGSNLHVSLEIPIEDFVFGNNREINISKSVKCLGCDGTGSDGPTTTCDDCHGQGQVTFMRGFMQLTTTCSKCQGSGKLIKKPCLSCRSQGLVEKNQQINVNIPKGIRPGQTLMFQGAGNDEAGTVSGDLMISLKVRKNSKFEISGNDLVAEIEINCFDACLGSSVNFETLDGEKLIKIPAGIQHSNKVKLSNLGFPVSANSSKRGNLFLKVNILIPENLNLEQRKILQCVKDLGEQYV